MPLGTHKIEITAHNIDPDIDPKQFTAIGATGPRPPATQYLPARYNRQTELEITIESGSGPVTRDFALE